MKLPEHCFKHRRFILEDPAHGLLESDVFLTVMGDALVFAQDEIIDIFSNPLISGLLKKRYNLTMLSAFRVPCDTLDKSVNTMYNGLCRDFRLFRKVR